MTRTSTVQDVACISLMTQIRDCITSEMVEVIQFINYKVDFEEVERAIKTICQNLSAIVIVRPIWRDRKIVAVQIIPI